MGHEGPFIAGQESIILLDRFEPMVYIGYLAAATREIVLGTTGIVLPTRKPMYLAKQATSFDQLSGGRLVLGLSSGDRQSDYPMLGVDYETRGERYRDAYSVFRTLTEQRFPVFRSPRFGALPRKLDLVPKASYGRVPAIAVGQAAAEGSGSRKTWTGTTVSGRCTVSVSSIRFRSPHSRSR